MRAPSAGVPLPGGRRTSVTDPLGRKTSYVYDTYGRLMAVVDPAGGTTRYGYDLMGNLTALRIGTQEQPVLQKKGEKDLLNVQRGDVLEGRFRVSSISEKEVVLVDTNLKIRHTIAFTVETGINQPFRPSVRTSDEVP